MEIICSLIEEKFGPVSAKLLDHLEQLPMDDLKRLAPKIGTGKSLAELELPEA